MGRTEILPDALFIVAIPFSQGRAVFIRGYVHLLSSLFSLVLMLTHREIPLENGSTVNYQRTPWAEIVLVHTVPRTFLSCSAVLYN